VCSGWRNNFEAAIAKFRIQAQHWLSLKHLGSFFQVLGYNMFAASVFHFVGQLYVLPPDDHQGMSNRKSQIQARSPFWDPWSWAFFRAGVEIGFPAVPTNRISDVVQCDAQKRSRFCNQSVDSR